MARRYSQAVILCEDRQQDSFIRRFLLKRGFTRHQLRSEICPKGKQAGEQYVRECYPGELTACRRRAAKAATALIVVIDADTAAVQEIVRRLEDACSAADVEKRTARDRVAILVPKRNIETWINYLDGVDVDEEQAYPKLKKESDCSAAVGRLLEICSRGECPADFPESLINACEEYRRIS